MFISKEEALWLLNVYQELLVMLVIENWEEFKKDPDIFILDHQNSLVDRLTKCCDVSPYNIKERLIASLKEMDISLEALRVRASVEFARTKQQTDSKITEKHTERHVEITFNK